MLFRGDLILSYLPEFVAKTESVTNPVARAFQFRSLSTVVGHDDEERLLCPFRALSGTAIELVYNLTFNSFSFLCGAPADLYRRLLSFFSFGRPSS